MANESVRPGDGRKEDYEEPRIQDFGEVHELTQHHGKIGTPQDAEGGSKVHSGGF